MIVERGISVAHVVWSREAEIFQIKSTKNKIARLIDYSAGGLECRENDISVHGVVKSIGMGVMRCLLRPDGGGVCGTIRLGETTIATLHNAPIITLPPENLPANYPTKMHLGPRCVVLSKPIQPR